MELSIYLLTALVYGWLEAFTMEHGFSTGPMDFFGFKKAYHGAMLALAVLIGLATGCVFLLPWWALVEDLSFWASSKWAFDYKFKLTQDSWIARMMGHIGWRTVMIPVIYILLLVAGCFTFIYL